MSVTIKSAREIELMREAGRILAKVHEELGKAKRRESIESKIHNRTAGGQLAAA